jgi:peptide/nickel transport system substrate-binding protein
MPIDKALAAMLLLATQASAQTLTIGIGGAVTSLDPHFFNAAPNYIQRMRASRS